GATTPTLLLFSRPVRPGGGVAPHALPPPLFDVPLQSPARRPVAQDPVDPAVNLARLKDEPAPPAQGHKFVHIHGCCPFVADPESSVSDQDYWGQWLLTIPTAPTSTRSGERRNSGTRAN